MAASDLKLIAGTTFSFGVTWQTQAGDVVTPVDITGCTARFQMREVASGALLAQASTESDGIKIIDGVKGEISVSLLPTKTKGLTNKIIGDVAYELRGYFPSGDVYTLMSGFVAIVEGVIRD